MMIVDLRAHSELIRTLKDLVNTEGRHFIRIHPVEDNAENARQIIITQTQNYLPGTDVYICEDGEMFLLTPAISAKECKKAMLAMASALHIQPAEHVGELYDLALQNGLVLALLEKKANHYRNAEQINLKQQAQEQTDAMRARKRQRILDQGVHKNASDIAAQRSLRSEPKLMIIEDDPFSRRLVKHVLGKRYDLTELDSAIDALYTYADIAPDLLFLDINLPDVTGHELLEKFIALDPQAYIIMLSGNADKTNIIQAMERSARGFIAKPFSRDKLFQYIERCPTIHKEKVIQ